MGLVSATVLTRHLGLVDFGRLMTVASLVALIGTVTEGGLNAYGVRELAVTAPDRARGLMRHLLGLRLLLTVAGVAAAVAFAAAAGYPQVMVVGTIVAGAGMLAYESQSTLSLPLAARLKLGSVTAAEVLRQAVYVTAVVVLALLGAGLLPMLSAPIAGGLAGLALMARLVHGEAPWRPAVDFAAYRAILRETLPVAAAGAVYSVYFRVIMVIMSLLATSVETGYFGVAFRVVEVLSSVPALVIGALLPLLSRAARDDELRLTFAFQRTVEVALIAGVGFAVVTAVAAPLVMNVLVVDQPVEPAIRVLQLQALTLLPIFANAAYAMTLVALRRHRELLLVNLIALSITVVVAAVLVPWAGAEGGALAAVAGEFALLGASFLVMRRGRADMRPSLRLLPRALAAAALAAGAAMLVVVPTLPNVAAALTVALVYPVALALLRGIPPELLDALRRRR